ncbi:MAG: hypothetical protein ACI8S6_002970, partial [Myxococcota bacterium]
GGGSPDPEQTPSVGLDRLQQVPGVWPIWVRGLQARIDLAMPRLHVGVTLVWRLLCAPAWWSARGVDLYRFISTTTARVWGPGRPEELT